MPFSYSTEYRLGRKGRIERSYTGIQALIAIASDLMLGFTFAVIGLSLWLVKFCLMTAYCFVVGLFVIPLRIVRAVIRPRANQQFVKPAFASYDEL